MSDYGAKKRNGGTVGLITSVGGVVALGVIAAIVFVVHRQDAASQVAAWTPKGVACQPVSKDAYTAFGSPAASAITYDGVRFAHASGHQKCGAIPGDDGHGGATVPVCQFSDPTTLQITTPKGDFYFLPGSQPATVVVSHDQPTCTLAINTTPNWFRD
jgi:hypothetical protein